MSKRVVDDFRGGPIDGEQDGIPGPAKPRIVAKSFLGIDGLLQDKGQTGVAIYVYEATVDEGEFERRIYRFDEFIPAEQAGRIFARLAHEPPMPPSDQ